MEVICHGLSITAFPVLRAPCVLLFTTIFTPFLCMIMSLLSKHGEGLPEHKSLHRE